MSADTPEQRQLRVQIAGLDSRIAQLRQELCATLAIAPVGAMIEFDTRLGVRRGKIAHFQSWAGDQLAYMVDVIRKDGSLGARRSVYPYHNPRLRRVLESPLQSTP